MVECYTLSDVYLDATHMVTLGQDLNNPIADRQRLCASRHAQPVTTKLHVGPISDHLR
jgi:hypothetical protein